MRYNIKLPITLFLILITFTSLVLAQNRYALDPCGQSSITDNGDGTYTYGNGCMAMTVPTDSFNQNFVVDNFLDGNTFQMTMQGISEENEFNDSEILFDDLSWTVDISDGYIKYISNSSFVVGYIISGNTFKSQATITNYNFILPNSTLWVKNLVKKSKANDTISFVEPIVDGSPIPIDSRITTQGQNTFYWQDVGNGALIEIDPLYSVDYSPVPAQYLITGIMEDYPDYSYITINDITTEMSDRNLSTYRSTYWNGITLNPNIGSAFKFEETSGNTSEDYGLIDVDMILYGSPNLVVGGASGSAIDFDGTDDYGIIPRLINVTAGQDFAFCIAINDAGVSSNARIVDNKGGGISQGIEFTLVPSDTIDFFVRRGATQTTLSGTTPIDDSTWHHTCAVSYANGTVDLYVDGVIEASGSGVTGAMVTTVNTYFGASDTLGSLFPEKLDEGCSWVGTNLNVPAIITGYNKSYCGSVTGTHISGNWNVTYDANRTYFLEVEQVSSGNHLWRVNAYDTQDNVSKQVVIYPTIGLGTHFIPINTLLDYEYSNRSLNFVKLRVSSFQNASVSEIFLFEQGNDTLPPVVTDCSLDKTFVNCSESVRLSCNVTDDFVIQEVLYQVNQTNYSAFDIGGDFWVYDFTPTGTDVSKIYTWEYAYARDYANFSNTTPVNLDFNYTCSIPCVENWTQDPVSCRINDTYIITYTDQNACGTIGDLPANNGTEDYCNYCSEDLVQVLGECQMNGTQAVTYTDNNYFTCCAVTDLSSDCSVDDLYPYNDTTSQSCFFFNNTMGAITCQNEPNFNIREKEYCLAYIPNVYLNETFRCISHVQDLATNEILQTNPEYRERAQSFIELGQDPETREWFTPANSIVNFYYTSKNLHPETEYVLEIECSSQQRTLSSSMFFQIAYEDYEFVFFRTRWLMANAGYIIAGLIVLLLIIIVLFWLWRVGTT